MVTVKITRFTGMGKPVVVVGAVRSGEPQCEPKPALRLIRGEST